MDTEIRSGVFLNVATGEEIIRPLTQDEIDSLIVPDGTETYPGGVKPEAPASDDASAPSTDAG